MYENPLRPLIGGRGLIQRHHRLPWIPSEEEWQNILQVCKQEPLRNRVMLAMSYDAALRREEICSLEVADIDPAHRLLRIRLEVTKNRRERVVPYSLATSKLFSRVRDAKFAGFALKRPAGPMFFVPLAQNVDYHDELMKKVELGSHFIGGIMLVTNMSTGALESLLTRTLAELDANLAITSIRTVQQQIELLSDQERAVASLAGLFGIVALVLAAIGLYGVTAYTVAQRTNEVGIRMALGADRANVIQLVLRGAFHRVLFGLVLGLPLTVGAGRLISTEPYNVSSWDPLAFTCGRECPCRVHLRGGDCSGLPRSVYFPLNALRKE